MAKPNVRRSGERLIRLAYELERLAVRLKAAGHESEGFGVQQLASQSGKIGRALDAKLRPNE